MAEAGSGEQDRSEAASPYKLERARRRGVVARGTDLGFVAVLTGIAIATQTTGPALVKEAMQAMRRSWTSAMVRGNSPGDALASIAPATTGLLYPLAVTLLVLFLVVVLFEIVQVRGLHFTAAPLKPDFGKLNPAKGLKRLFSLRLLKELAKSILKLAAYATGAWLLIRSQIETTGTGIRSAEHLAEAILRASGRLLILFLAIAVAVAILDQIIARGEFAKQMRMSRREVTREAREREGEPRQKRRRKQIMAELLKQAAAAANVKGADVLIVNPTHYAVALSYRPGEQAAPVVVAAGRNRWAMQMRKVAQQNGVVIVRNPRLARALYNGSRIGSAIAQSEFVAVADVYIMLRRLGAAQRRQDAGTETRTDTGTDTGTGREGDT